jgi:hypothetical protein
MFGNRKIMASLAGETLEESVVMDFPQGGILSPLLRNLLAAKLIKGLI